MIYVEKGALGSIPHGMLDSAGLSYTVVDDGFAVRDNKSNILLTTSNGNENILDKCPATTVYRCCNYNVVNIMEGCPYNCSYCILQEYLSHSYIKVYSDIDRLKSLIADRARETDGLFRLGTGELCDSLALDHIFPFSAYFANIVGELDNVLFELKTKSANITNLLKVNPRNMMVSFSVNPEEIVNSEEFGTSSVEARIKAAATAAAHGFKVGFHFDPLIYYDNWEEGYKKLIHQLVNGVDEESIAYISVSTFRYMPKLMDTIRHNFLGSHLLSGDYVKCLDGKMRYFKPLRVRMLREVTSMLRHHWQNVFIYYCMEHASVWEKIMNYDPGDREEFEQYFCNKQLGGKR